MKDWELSSMFWDGEEDEWFGDEKEAHREKSETVWQKPFSPKVCECGCNKTYGPKNNLHMDWCPLYVR